VVEEELGVGESKTIFHDGTSGWEDVDEEDEALAQLEDLENGHTIEGMEERAVVTVSNVPMFFMILFTVSRILEPLRFAGSNPAGRRQHNRALPLYDV
jgi:hypothetical protein